MWLGELTVQESKFARDSRPGCKRYERGGSANLRCKKVNPHGLADPTRLQGERAGRLGELAVQESCKRYERGGSANLRCKKVNPHGLADPTRLQGERAGRLGELAVQESNIARLSRPSKVERGTSDVARRTYGAGKGNERGGSANVRCSKVNSHRLADSEVCKRHERGGSVNLRCRKLSSNGLAYPPRLQEVRARWLGELAVQESCKRHEGRGSANLRSRKVSSHGFADPARLQGARATRLGALAVQESNHARVSIPGKVARGTSDVARRTCGAGKLACSGYQTRPGCKWRERGGSANLRCRKVSSHGLADPARLREARARWLGELNVQESKLARVSILV
ncbi:hypothetical protein CRG98_037775 [Punica granatum]|uniref:Uncharacterized protein n=1 Tax=Punica granatum TaxID=22663 RepID=A0A2I0ICX1_PUNGR|nr:hypothetical protein CRG98_037775 [Punica granatum]